MFDVDGYALYSLKTTGNFKADLGSRGDRERVVFSLKGDISVNGQDLSEKDMMYVPIGDNLRIESKSDSVIFVAEANASKKYDTYVKKYTEANKMKIGQPTFRRTVVQSITENDPGTDSSQDTWKILWENGAVPAPQARRQT